MISNISFPCRFDRHGGSSVVAGNIKRRLPEHTAELIHALGGKPVRIPVA